MAKDIDLDDLDQTVMIGIAIGDNWGIAIEIDDFNFDYHELARDN